MVEIIELRITSPRVETPGLDAAIASLKEFKTIYDSLAKLPPIAIQGFSAVAGSVRQMSDYSKLVLQSFERLGQTDATAAMRKGFATLGEEVTFIDQKLAQLRGYSAGSPGPGSPLRVGNPALDKKLSEIESATAALNLRRQEITVGLPSDVGAQKITDHEATALAAAEQKVTAAATGATSALSQQGQVVATKSGQMGQLATSAGQVVTAEGALGAAAQRDVLLSERYIEKEGDRKLAQQQFITGVGQTRTALGEEGKVVIENTNFLEQYRNALRANTAEFANRRVVVTRGSAAEVQLLRDEAAAIQNIGRSFSGFIGQSDQQRAEVRGAALLRRAAEAERQLNQTAVTRFQQLQPAFTEAGETRRTTLPTGETVKRETLTRENDGMRESITLTSRLDAQGKLLNATLDETNSKISRVGRTTQGTLLGTVGMAAKFIAIYRGIDLLIRGFEFGIEAAIKFERQLATLSIVYHGTADEAHAVGLAVLDQAAKLGQSGTAALEVATDFARFGFRQAEVLEATRVALVAANVAQLDLAQSGKYLQSILSAYQLQVGQLAGVLGSLDTVSHSFNVTNKQLLEGLARVAPLAKQAGISLNELIGYEAAISGRTGRPGAEAGVALQTFLARLNRPATQGALQDIAGVSITAPSGELKKASEIINELFISYQNLTQAEQQELLIKIAGTRQASRIAALLDGYLKTQELSIKASLDQGRAERENIAIRQTLASQLGTLSSEWQKFWVASAGRAGGLQSNITELVKGLSLLLNKLSEVENKVGQSKPYRPVEQMSESDLRKEIAPFQRPVAQRTFDQVAALLGGKGQPLVGLPGIIRAAEIEHQLELLEKQKKGTLSVAESEEIADKKLIQFEQDLGKIEQRGNAFDQAGRGIQTIEKLIDRAPVEKLGDLVDSAARFVAPLDVRRQEQVREELQGYIKLNDVSGLHARLKQLETEAYSGHARAVTETTAKLKAEIDAQQKALALDQDRRKTVARGGDEARVDALDKEIEAKQRQVRELQRRLSGAVVEQFPDVGEPYQLDTAKAAAEQKKAALQTQFEGIQRVFSALPKPELFGAGGTSAVEEIKRQISEVEDKAREIERERMELAQETVGITNAEKIARDGELQTALESLRVDKDKLESLRAYAELQDQIARGVRQATIQPEQFKIGRNETEQLSSEAAGIQSQLLPRVLQRFDEARATRNPALAAGAEAEALGLSNRLVGIQLSLDERRYKLAADIVNEKRKEAEEASKSLQLASREDQLRAALTAKFIQNRGGRGFSENEFQFLDQETRRSIQQFNPSALPPTVPTRARDLEREQTQLNRVFSQLSDAIKKAVEDINKKVGQNLEVSPHSKGIDVKNLPGAFNLPAINIDVRDQIAELTTHLQDVVVARFDAELTGIRDEVRGFINSQRINSAQSAATGAI